MMSKTKSSETTFSGPDSKELVDSYKRTLALLQKRAEGMRKRESPNLQQAEVDLLVFLKLLQITHSLFKEVDELKQAIQEIGQSIGVDSSGSAMPN